MNKKQEEIFVEVCSWGIIITIVLMLINEII